MKKKDIRRINMTVKEMIELLKLFPQDAKVMADFSEFKGHAETDDVILGSGDTEGSCFIRLEADNWREEIDRIKKEKLNDIMDMVKDNLTYVLTQLSLECKKHQTEDECVNDCPYFVPDFDCCFFDHPVSSWSDLAYKLHKGPSQQSFEYKGYTLVQELRQNHHFSIFDKDGKFVFHAQCEKKLESQKEAEECIEGFLSLIEVSRTKIKHSIIKPNTIIKGDN